MAKEVHHTYEGGDSGSSFLLGIVLLIVFLAVFLYWGLPAIRGMQNQGIQIQVPDNIQVNISGAPAE